MLNISDDDRLAIRRYADKMDVKVDEDNITSVLSFIDDIVMEHGFDDPGTYDLLNDTGRKYQAIYDRVYYNNID